MPGVFVERHDTSAGLAADEQNQQPAFDQRRSTDGGGLVDLVFIRQVFFPKQRTAAGIEAKETVAKRPLRIDLPIRDDGRRIGPLLLSGSEFPVGEDRFMGIAPERFSRRFLKAENSLIDLRAIEASVADEDSAL